MMELLMHDQLNLRMCVSYSWSWCVRLLDRSLMVEPLSYFSFQPILHNWLWYVLSCLLMVHIKDPLLLIERISHVATAGFLSCCLNSTLPNV